jgi:hypothetical protein
MHAIKQKAEAIMNECRVEVLDHGDDPTASCYSGPPSLRYAEAKRKDVMGVPT